jgi:hypothetical protein
MEVNDVLRVGLYVPFLLTLKQSLNLQAKVSQRFQLGVTTILSLVLRHPRILGDLEELRGHDAALELMLIDRGAGDDVPKRRRNF